MRLQVPACSRFVFSLFYSLASSFPFDDYIILRLNRIVNGFAEFFYFLLIFFRFYRIMIQTERGGAMSNLGNKKTMAKNIRYYMEKNSLSQTDICNTLGIKMPTFSDWVNAKTYPRIDKIELMANYFGISKSDLVEDHSIIDKTHRNGVSIPVYGRVAAGIPIEMIEDIIDTEEISEEMARTGEFFALQIHGDSMEPKMSDGDIVIVRKQEDAESGDTVIATVNGTDATCKRLKKYAEGIALISTNPAYEPKYFSNTEVESKPVRIIGRVVELRAKF